MRAYALQPEKRKFDRSNLPPVKVGDREKVSLSNPTSSREVILRDTLPPNVILFAQFLKTLNEGKLDLVFQPSKQSPWQNNTISSLYRRFFLHFHPERFSLESYHLFLGLTLPSLVRFMSFQSIKCLCHAIHWRNRKLLLASKVSREKFRRRFMAVIYNTFIPLPPAHPQIRSALHTEAWRIIWALATHEGQGDGIEGRFFISSREFRDRLFIKCYKKAQRILERFCEIGVIVKIASGTTRWEAAARGQKAKANVYRLNFDVTENSGVRKIFQTS